MFYRIGHLVTDPSFVLPAKKAKSIDEGLEEVVVLIDTHFFTELSGTQFSAFLKKVIMYPGSPKNKHFGHFFI